MDQKDGMMLTLSLEMWFLKRPLNNEAGYVIQQKATDQIIKEINLT